VSSKKSNGRRHQQHDERDASKERRDALADAMWRTAPLKPEEVSI
jgi:hypothetical protein